MFESFYQKNYQDVVYHPLTLKEKKKEKERKPPFSPFLVKAFPCVGPWLGLSRRVFIIYLLITSGIFCSVARPCAARTRIFRVINAQNGVLRAPPSQGQIVDKPTLI